MKKDIDEVTTTLDPCRGPRRKKGNAGREKIRREEGDVGGVVMHPYPCNPFIVRVRIPPNSHLYDYLTLIPKLITTKR